jgi:hypothetical protein
VAEVEVEAVGKQRGEAVVVGQSAIQLLVGELVVVEVVGE